MFAHIAKRICRPLTIKLVDRYHVGKVQHIDFFKLTGGTKFRRHYVHRDIAKRDNSGIALAYARCFDNYQIKSGQFGRGDDISQLWWHITTGLAGGNRAHKDMGMINRVHPNAISEQRATGLAPGWIDRENSNF